jgi:hypothetical protein
LSAFEELKKLVKDSGANYTDEELKRALLGKGSIKCGWLPNWTTQKDLTCKREALCNENRTKDLKCALRLIKTAGQLRKKYWLEEV